VCTTSAADGVNLDTLPHRPPHHRLDGEVNLSIPLPIEAGVHTDAFVGGGGSSASQQVLSRAAVLSFGTMAGDVLPLPPLDEFGIEEEAAALPITTNPVGKAQHLCEHCTYSSHKKSDVKRHTFTHTGQRPYPCRAEPGCTKSFKHPSTRCRHEQAKHGSGHRFLCDFQGCQKNFSREDNLWSHQRDKHAGWELIKLPSIVVASIPATVVADDDFDPFLQAVSDVDLDEALVWS
jgi:hypothetical protein